MNTLKNLITIKQSFRIFLLITTFALVYHLLIITQVVDYKNAWGGQLTNVDQMYVFETFSILSQIIFTFIAYVKSNAQKGTRAYQYSKIVVFLIALLFLLNTFGNLMAIEIFERIVFTPLTFLSSVFLLRIALE